MRSWNRTRTQQMIVAIMITTTSLVGLVGQVRADCEQPPCPIEFEFSCPNAGEICSATFSGGNSCVIDFVPNCYSSGQFSYAIDPFSPLTISLSQDLVSLDVFFAHRTGGSGEMTFFDAGGVEVDAPLPSNGPCGLIMPPSQSRNFSTPVRSIEVVATGDRVYIDSFVATFGGGISPGPPDFDGDCEVRVPDLIVLLGAWGACPEPCTPGDPALTCPADLDGDCQVRVPDLIILLGAWGSV